MPAMIPRISNGWRIDRTVTCGGGSVHFKDRSIAAPRPLGRPTVVFLHALKDAEPIAHSKVIPQCTRGRNLACRTDRTRIKRKLKRTVRPTLRSRILSKGMSSQSMWICNRKRVLVGSQGEPTLVSQNQARMQSFNGLDNPICVEVPYPSTGGCNRCVPTRPASAGTALLSSSGALHAGNEVAAGRERHGFTMSHPWYRIDGTRSESSTGTSRKRL
jgi:hypothetical protein